MNHLITICDCHDPHHMMAFYYDEENDPEFDELYVETQLNQALPWWKRVIVAVGYVLGKRSIYGYGHWAEGSIGIDSAKELRVFLDKFTQRAGGA